MDEFEFRKLLEQPESPKLDYKREQYRLDNDHLKSQFVKDIVCMANSLGREPGHIIIGVEDISEEGRRIPRGVDRHHDDAELQAQVKDKARPVPIFSYRPLTYAGQQFAVIDIQPGYRIHQSTKNFGVLKEHVVYIRVGTSNREASIDELEELARDRGRRQLDRLREELVWTRDPEVNPSTAVTWEPQWFLQDSKEDNAFADGPIRTGQLVIGRFQRKPSLKWKDPGVEIRGLWNDIRKVVIPTKRPLMVVLPDSAEAPTQHVPLCIPSYDVDVELREETHIAGPLWGPVKSHIVRQFLKACEGKDMICRVAYIGRNEGRVVFNVNSPDYDRYLICEWPYYKGLENALSKNRLYKHADIVNMSESNLRSFVANDLIASNALMEMIPHRYKTMWHGRSLDTESVFLVLRGLIQRYSVLST